MTPLELEERYGADIYHPLPVVIVQGKGALVWDDKGNEYIDLLSAYSAVSHGHCHPKLLETLRVQSEKLCIPSRAFHNDRLGPFLEKICTLSRLDMAIPMNSGSEAVETAIKSARLWGHRVKGVDFPEIIVVEGNFHGRTTTVISFSSEAKYKEGFAPLTPGFKTVPYGDVEAFKKAITPKTAAFLVEPIQGEAGVVIPPVGYLSSVAKICKEENVLLILDEIQSGLGRTGKMFAFEHENLKPDGLILGKALGGGILPISAFVAKKEILSLYKPGMHGSTFGGNPLACAVAIEALNVLIEERLVEKSRDLGEYLLKKISSWKSPLITEIRGKGLWFGLEIDPRRCKARAICESLMKKGVLAKETHETVIRIAPPLTILKEELDRASDIIEKTLKEMR